MKKFLLLASVILTASFQAFADSNLLITGSGSLCIGESGAVSGQVLYTNFLPMTYGTSWEPMKPIKEKSRYNLYTSFDALSFEVPEGDKIDSVQVSINALMNNFRDQEYVASYIITDTIINNYDILNDLATYDFTAMGSAFSLNDDRTTIVFSFTDKAFLDALAAGKNVIVKYSVANIQATAEDDVWNASFYSNGISAQVITSQIPESGAYAAVLGIAALGFVALRRKSKN